VAYKVIDDIFIRVICMLLPSLWFKWVFTAVIDSITPIIHKGPLAQDFHNLQDIKKK